MREGSFELWKLQKNPSKVYRYFENYLATVESFTRIGFPVTLQDFPNKGIVIFSLILYELEQILQAS